MNRQKMEKWLAMERVSSASREQLIKYMKEFKIDRFLIAKFEREEMKPHDVTRAHRLINKHLEASDQAVTFVLLN
ncbi:MAG: hypothetical protein CUN56_00090 [Phototrophicales bacterium]|nr:MAG: hypothetical protein CUN56_00090 [Phototrophicales bacterium]